MTDIVSFGDSSFFRIDCVEGVSWNGKLWRLHLQSGNIIDLPDTTLANVATLKELILKC
jgi:hypothetical protein